MVRMSTTRIMMVGRHCIQQFLILLVTFEILIALIIIFIVIINQFPHLGGNERITSLLIHNRANVNQVDKDGVSILHWLSVEGNFEIN